MTARFYKYVRAAVLSLVITLSAVQSYGSHIFGVDLYYTHATADTYVVNLVIYGDCSGPTFSSLLTAVPEIDVYNGDYYIETDTLALQAPFDGVNVTPVCPADSDSTACNIVGSPIPGIKRFVYTAKIVISDTSSVWNFQFQGNMGGVSAGRSGSITNIVSGSVIQLVDTLNNVAYDNSSSIYNTIPTPFFCINAPDNFNPAAVDPDGDSLVFNLVPGIDATTASSVSYVTPYTATAPLGTVAGAFSFSSTTGQLSFTPNIVQRGLVVYNVEEYHDGVLRGTSQREMTVVIISPCTTYPASGSISGASGGSISDSIEFNICSDGGPFSFHINPTDIDGDTLQVSFSGLPTGASLSIANNNTPAPLGTFVWSTIGVAPGSYTFYVTYRDNGCPLASTQTQAYTVTIYPQPTAAYTEVTPASCHKKAVFHLATPATFGPYKVVITQGSSIVQTVTGVTGTLTDSLAPGAYTIYTYNADSCYVDTTIFIASPVALAFTGAAIVKPTCLGYKDGSVAISDSGGTPPYTYSINDATFYSNNTFDTLLPGTYTFYVRDSNKCSIDTTITLTGLPHILVNHISVSPPACYGATNGSITLSVNGGVPPLHYSINGDTTRQLSDVFDSLATGIYTVVITDDSSCVKDTTITMSQPAGMEISTVMTPNECLGYDTKGSIQATITGGTAPLAYLWNTEPPQTTLNISGLTNGPYTLHITDANNCTDSVTVEVTYDDCCTPFIPTGFTPNDDGLNDVFRIRVKGDMSIIAFSIYNRFGQVVYTVSNTDDIEKGWDGKLNGVPAEFGTYYYYAKISCGNKRDHIREFKGDITLIR